MSPHDLVQSRELPTTIPDTPRSLPATTNCVRLDATSMTSWSNGFPRTCSTRERKNWEFFGGAFSSSIPKKNRVS